MRTQRQFISDILEMIDLAEHFTDGVSPEDLARDLKTQLALQRCFVIIGEAAGKIDAALRQAYPEVPWREMISMRNLVVHGYWTVRLDIILETIRRDLPLARERIEQIRDDLPPEPFES